MLTDFVEFRRVAFSFYSLVGTSSPKTSSSAGHWPRIPCDASHKDLVVDRHRTPKRLGDHKDLVGVQRHSDGEPSSAAPEARR